MAEISHMRGLLDELNRLSVLECGACGACGACARRGGAVPAKLEGVREVWNENLGWIGAGYVLRKCDALLAVTSKYLSQDTKKHLENLKTALEAAYDAQKWFSDGDDNVAQSQKWRKRNTASAVKTQYETMFPELTKVMSHFIQTENRTWDQQLAELTNRTKQASRIGGSKRGDLANDTFAVALSAFLNAIDVYMKKHFPYG